MNNIFNEPFFNQNNEFDDEKSSYPIIHNNSSLDINQFILLLKGIYDPEISYSIYDLGLIYGIAIDAIEREIIITMTLTSANCPEANSLPLIVKNTISEYYHEYKVEVNVTFEPEWTIDNMTDEVKLGLNLL